MKKVLFLLGHLNDTHIEWLLNYGSKFNISKNDYLIENGQKVDYLYIVLSGKFKIVDGSTDQGLVVTIPSERLILIPYSPACRKHQKT